MHLFMPEIFKIKALMLYASVLLVTIQLNLGISLIIDVRIYIHAIE